MSGAPCGKRAGSSGRTSAAYAFVASVAKPPCATFCGALAAKRSSCSAALRPLIFAVVTYALCSLDVIAAKLSGEMKPASMLAPQRRRLGATVPAISGSTPRRASLAMVRGL